MNSLVPKSRDPIGHDKFLLRQKQTESTSLTTVDTGTPKYSAALKTRAPSICNFNRFSLQIPPNSSSHFIGKTFPPHMLCVFSMRTNAVVGSCTSNPLNLLRSSLRQNVPSGLLCIRLRETPAICAAPPCSYKKLCAKWPVMASLPLRLQWTITWIKK